MTPLGQTTLAAVERAMEGKQASTLVALTTLLDALAFHGETVSFADLSALINCDGRLVARVLTLANSIALRPGSTPVTSITSAFHVLGISQLRTMVLSALLAQHADSDNFAQREMAVLSLASGLVAQALAARWEEDPEQGFLCGSLRNYGNLLLSTFRQSDFDRARAEGVTRRDEDGAFLKTFGLSSYELGGAMLTGARLPRPIMDAVAGPANAAIGRSAEPAMVRLARAGVSFSDLLFDPTLSPTNFRTRARELLPRSPSGAVTSDAGLDEFLSVLQAAFTEYARFVDFAGIADRPLLSISRRIANAKLLDCPVVPTRPSVHLGAPEDPTQAAGADSPFIQPRDIAPIAAAYEASDVLVFSLDGALGSFRLTEGLGALSKRLRGTPLFAEGDTHMFGICVSRRRAIAVYDLNQIRRNGATPPWMQSTAAPISFFALPLGEPTVRQVLLVGWSTPHKVVPHSIAEVLARCRAQRHELVPAHAAA